MLDALVCTQLIIIDQNSLFLDLAIARTTPVLLALFSVMALLAHQLQQQKLPIAAFAWYKKQYLTSSDALAAVRQYLWQKSNFCISREAPNMIRISQTQFNLWQQSMAWAT